MVQSQHFLHEVVTALSFFFCNQNMSLYFTIQRLVQKDNVLCKRTKPFILYKNVIKRNLLLLLINLARSSKKYFSIPYTISDSILADIQSRLPIHSSRYLFFHEFNAVPISKCRIRNGAYFQTLTLSSNLFRYSKSHLLILSIEQASCFPEIKHNLLFKKYCFMIRFLF